MKSLILLNFISEKMKPQFLQKYRFLSENSEILNLLIYENQESPRLYGSNNKIKIPSHYKFQHCMYQIIKCFNNTNNTVRECVGTLGAWKRCWKKNFYKPYKNVKSITATSVIWRNGETIKDICWSDIYCCHNYHCYRKLDILCFVTS